MMGFSCMKAVFINTLLTSIVEKILPLYQTFRCITHKNASKPATKYTVLFMLIRNVRNKWSTNRKIIRLEARDLKIFSYLENLSILEIFIAFLGLAFCFPCYLIETMRSSLPKQSNYIFHSFRFEKYIP